MSVITQSCRVPTPDERMSAWAAVWYACGFHRAPERTQPLRQPAPHASPVRTRDLLSRAPGAVQAPGANLPASPDACSRVQVGAGRQSIHASPCTCVDDAQRHYALIARDLMTTGRADELTDDMRQAYDYEFGGVQEPEPSQIPEF